MGRNNTHLKGKEKSPERVLSEIEGSQLYDIEFKTMGIRKLIELSENYQKLQRSYKELTEKYISMKKELSTKDKRK